MRMTLAAMVIAAGFLLTVGHSATLDAQDDTEPGLGGDGAISGTITFPDGSPAAQKVVEWRPLGNIDGGSTAVTDKDGRYVIEGLRPGTYQVGFFEESRLPADKNSELVRNDDGAPQLAGREKRFGKLITLAEGEQVRGVDFVITNIGNEQVEGPETDGSTVGLPSAGGMLGSREGGSAGPTWILALMAAIVVTVIGLGLWHVIRRPSGV